ncbi:nuclear transport factor 2 family protein [Streptomyces bambusae]|uniref:nuclear transport factor 2 family protein n=1 Tax=Streptomyces bambusae TaxID=1550616 RepID=UPI001CFF59F7|nr:nuclear transport factor 2 family protein [Streptomyces bambusae]MCB5169576.1 nuclear transport factor 2 family protein [Streptomyces bambusae]
MTATGIARALDDLLFAPLPDLAEAIDRHFAPDYRQRTNGEWGDRDGFARHMARLRELVRSGHVEVHEELRDGLRYADRHTVTVTKHDGRTSRIEVHLFAELAADGRFRRVDESTRLVDGPAGDAALAHVQ